MLQPESRSNLLRVEIPAPEWDPLLMEVKWFVFMAEGADERQREVTHAALLWGWLDLCRRHRPKNSLWSESRS